MSKFGFFHHYLRDFKGATMFFTLKILVLLAVASTNVKSVKDKDDGLQKFKWAKKYTLDATKIYLTSGLIENIKYWHTKNKSRIDYNNGSVKSIAIKGKQKKLKFKNFGIKYEIFPETTEEFQNRMFCHYKNGSLLNPVEVEEILPSESEYVFVGKDILETGEVHKFVYKEVSDYESTESRSYVWASQNSSNVSWIPVKVEEFQFDTWLGNPKKHVVWNILNYQEEFNDNVFDISSYNCTSEPEPDDYTLLNVNNKNHIGLAFKKFQTEYGRQYKNENEHEIRKKIFEDNMRLIQAHNRKNSTFKVGINKFSDRTPEELKKMKGLRRRKVGETGTHKFPHNETEVAKISVTLPTEFDLRMLGVITPVKDQDLCGSCWTFGTTSAVEGALARSNGGRLLRLANQALIDCAWGFNVAGCDGGSDTAAYKWMMKYGLPTEEEYGPYVNKDGFCNINNMTKLYSIKGFTDVTPYSIEALKVALVNHGPLSVSMDASSPFLVSYTGGIYYDTICNKEILNHEVTLVGYGERDGEEYWICKNSWGTNWGIDGYFHISTRNTDCGITTEPTYVVL